MNNKEFNDLKNIVLDLHKTVNNGLTERTKEIREDVKLLKRNYNELNVASKQQGHDHATVIERLNNVSDNQKRLNKWIFGSLVVVNGWLIAALFWIIQHSREIATLLEKLTS